MLALPLLFFIALEALLRGINYGGNLSLFIPAEAAPGYLRINPNFASRYFPSLRVTPETSNDVFTTTKAVGAYRIFVLGGSSAYGYPYGHNGSFSKFLLQRLQMQFPEKSLEVVNLAMPAINSFTLLDMLDEVWQQQPDAFVIYAGHNEYYGALGVGSTESFGQSRPIIKLYLKLQRFRAFLFLRNQLVDLKRWFTKRAATDEGATLMEHMVGNKFIPIGSTAYHRGVDFFRRNLQEMGQAAHTRGLPVYFCTLVSNLRDQPPFVSLASGKIDSLFLHREMQRGRNLEIAGAFVEALNVYQKLAEKERTYAELYYRIGKCLETLGRYDEARDAYQQARDLDALRFRSPAVFNDVIRQVAGETENALVEVDSAFAAASPHGLMGSNLFLEHLHPNLQGYFIIGRVIAQTMQREGAIARIWENSSALSDSLLRQHRGVTPLDLEVAKIRIQVLTSRWPFVPERRSADFQYQPQNEIQQIAYDLWRKHLSWEQAHVKAAEHYTKEGNLRLAAAEYDALILETPYNPSPYLRSGIVHIMLGDMEVAEQRFKASLLLNETPEAHENLGAILLQQKKIIEAVAHLERALQLQPGNTQALYNLTGGYILLGQADKAEQTLRRLENLQPGSIEVAGLRSDLANLQRSLEKRP